jgi:SAM-dependent methyltransferase
MNAASQLNDWYQTPLGRSLLAAEKIGLDNTLQMLFGYYLLQLGGPNEESFLQASRIHTKILLGPEIPLTTSQNWIQANYRELPFLPDSLDTVIIFHLLEFANNPKEILNEVAHALLPNGSALIFCFNPFSLWGLARRFKNRKLPPWNGKFIRPSHLRHWLKEVGLHAGDYSTSYFRPPLESEQISKKLLFLEPVSQMFLPYFGGSYMFVAKKTVATMTPVKQELYRHEIADEKSLVKPVVRNS